MGTTVVRLALVVVLLLAILGDEPKGPDTPKYMAFLRSLMLDGDLSLANDMELAGIPIFITRTGYALNNANLGIVLFWSPFFLLAHASAGTLAWMAPGRVPAPDGFQPMYVAWLRFADFVYGLLALALTCGAVRLRFGPEPARLATAAVAVGSPFVYYMGLLSPGTHMVSAFLASLFLYGFLLPASADDELRWPVLGAVGGLALTVANTSVALLALPAVHFGRALLSRGWTPRQWAVRVASFALFYVLAAVPQLLAWQLFLGEWLRSPYDQQLAWTEPRWFEVLFSSFHGAFFYAPLLLLATAGVALLAKHDWPTTLAALLVLGTGAYLNSVNLAWWAGGSFGARYLLGATPIFALGCAALFAHARGAGRGLLLGISGVSAAWTWLLYLTVGSGLASLTEYYPPAEQLANVREVLLAPAQALRRALRPSVTVIMFLPCFLVVAAWLVRHPERVVDAARASPGRAAIVLMPFAFAGVVLWAAARSDGPRDAWLRAADPRLWVRADRDERDLAYSLAERAMYHAKRNEWQQAEADREAAVRIRPSDPELRRRLARVPSR